MSEEWRRELSAALKAEYERGRRALRQAGARETCQCGKETLYHRHESILHTATTCGFAQHSGVKVVSAVQTRPRSLDLYALQAIADEALPGPWSCAKDGSSEGWNVVFEPGRDDYYVGYVPEPTAVFIAAAREAIPDLIRAVHHFEAEVVALREAWRLFCKPCAQNCSSRGKFGELDGCNCNDIDAVEAAKRLLDGVRP